MCNANDKCAAFEYGMHYKSKKAYMKAGDCQLQSEYNNDGCNGSTWNTDLYIKKDTNNAKSLSYSNWASHEPNDHGGREDCVEMLAGGEWNDLYCDNKRNSKRPYVCQKEQEAEHAHSGAVYGDFSFLDGIDSFNEADYAREKYVAE